MATTPQPERCCGTCILWGPEDLDTDGTRQCEWPTPKNLPFWAAIDRGCDHEDATGATDGRRCPAWTPKPQTGEG